MGGRKDKMTGHKITLKIREHPYKTSAPIYDFLIPPYPKISTKRYIYWEIHKKDFQFWDILGSQGSRGKFLQLC